MSERDDEKEQKEQKDRDEKQRQNDLRKQINVEHVWNQVDINEDRIDPGVDDSPGWKTVRIFVSSTFKDFHQEREILIKEVFADLRAWCEERQLHLIDCDLRWGVPKETTSEVTLRTCLEEIDRCYTNNKVPYFVNMTCKRIGWIPLDEELPPKLLSNYRLVFGLSVTEMEIVHAAYRIENPNALFLIRDDAFLDEITDESVKSEFIDELQPMAEEKLQVLKDKITSRFPDRVVNYKCKYVEGERLYTDYTGEKGRPKLKLDENFSKTVLNFFKERIAQQYPIVPTDSDSYQDAKYHHEAFMRSRSEVVLGREEILKEIANYITSESANYPKVVVGEAGAGKSSIIARAVSETLLNIQKKMLPCIVSSSGLDWTVFYHFVGAVPNSTNLLEILRRLLNELLPNQEFPETLEETMEVVKCELSRDYQKPIIIFIDALNQIDRDTGVETMFWLPEKLSHNVRCVLSLKSGSETHATLRKHKLPSEAETAVPDLQPKTRIEIVNKYLGLFNKKLEGEQLVILMVKNSSKNPLWLRIACEELRIYGDFATITNFMETLEDGLPNLLRQVLERFEKELDKVLLISTLCLLEVSRFGLLECELLEILADKEHLEYRKSNRDKRLGTNTARLVLNTAVHSMVVEDKAESRVKEKGRHLPAMEWAAVYRNLRFFLRPFGNPSEGRLDFYHRMLSEVVRKMYLTGTSDADRKDRLWWWHKKLADFYSRSGTYDRKVEEYPYHLIRLKQFALDDVEKRHYCKQLENFLLDMGAFKRLYDHEFSAALLYYWRQSDDESYNKMTQGYKNALEEMKNDTSYTTEKLAEKCEDFSRLLVQAGKYKEGLELAEECLNMLNALDDGPDKQEKLMFVYGHKAHIKSLSANEIPELQEIIQLHENAIQIIKDNGLEQKDKKFKKYLALQLIKKAYARGGIASRCESFPTSLSGLSKIFSRKTTKKEMTEQGLKEVDEAIKIYREIKDFGHELEAQLTMATLNRGEKEKQLEIYKTTRDRCCQIFGEDHHLMCRLCFNTAIVYEDAKEVDEAYTFFRKAYDIAMRVFGPEHAMTEKYRSTLKEGKYERIGKKLGHKLV